VTDSTGKYEIEIPAEIGDLLYVWQAYQTLESPPSEILVPEKDEDNSIPAPGIGGADAGE
jgi:hypothetical protein